ncbi:porin family protein [Scleromatobacter humisilvae]|uniref:Porin family protein n=1 Tax=Scleromatobacter humisilvae TaxID=2897159 RepID=A0A9X1YSM6_9BURK|nr:porin family protein [Scleromatobacter humisilvae]MCK9688551.1 porin family protein [Scleromatobacter humisilvae]
MSLKTFLQRHLFAAIVGVASALQAGACHAQLDDIFVPAIGDVLGHLPTIDGVPTESGWNNAGEVGLSEVTGAGRAGFLRYGIANQALYLAVDYDNPAFTIDPAVTTLVLVISPEPSNPQNDIRLHITGFGAVGASSAASSVPTVQIWHGSTHWNQVQTNTSGNPACPAIADYGAWANCSTPLALDVSGVTAANQDCTLPSAGPSAAQYVINVVGKHISFEARIPFNDGGNFCRFLPSMSTTFGFYADLVNIETTGTTSHFFEDAFPVASVMNAGAAGVQITQATPDKAHWANASFFMRPECVGVDIVQAGVSQDPVSGFGNTTTALHVSQTTQAQCDSLANDYLWSGTQSAPTGTRSADNYYRAQLTNKTAADIAAHTLSTQFSIAPWGLGSPDEWDAIGRRYDPDASATPNDNIDVTSLNAGALSAAQSLVQQTDWRLSYKESCEYSLTGLTGFLGHHCVQAAIQSTDPALKFLHRSIQFNNNVLQASHATTSAHVGTRGYGPPPAGETRHKVILALDQQASQLSPDGNWSLRMPPKANASSRASTFANFPPLALGSRVTQELDVVARGYLETGDVLIIDNKKYRRARYAGAFTMQVGHDGPIDGWALDMTPKSCPGGGNGCVRRTPTGYELSIPENESVDLDTVVDAIEPGGGGNGGANGPWAAWLGLGATIPHGSFSNAHDGGFAGTLGLEYAINPQLSVEATLAAHHFDGKGGADAIDVTAFGVDAKYYVTPAPLRWFVDGGIGIYAFDPGSTRFGGTIGGGVQVGLGHGWAIEGRYNLQSVTSNAPDTTWSTLQVAVRKAF